MKPRKPVTAGVLFIDKLEDLHPSLKDYTKVPLFKSAIDKDETIGDVEMVGGIDDTVAPPSTKTLGDTEIGPSTPQTVPEEGRKYCSFQSVQQFSDHIW